MDQAEFERRRAAQIKALKAVDETTEMQRGNCELCAMEYQIEGIKPLGSCLRCETYKERYRRVVHRVVFKRLPAKYRMKDKTDKIKRFKSACMGIAEWIEDRQHSGPSRSLTDGT